MSVKMGGSSEEPPLIIRFESVDLLKYSFNYAVIDDIMRLFPKSLIDLKIDDFFAIVEANEILKLSENNKYKQKIKDTVLSIALIDANYLSEFQSNVFDEIVLSEIKFNVVSSAHGNIPTKKDEYGNYIPSQPDDLSSRIHNYTETINICTMTKPGCVSNYFSNGVREIEQILYQSDVNNPLTRRVKAMIRPALINNSLKQIDMYKMVKSQKIQDWKNDYDLDSTVDQIDSDITDIFKIIDNDGEYIFKTFDKYSLEILNCQMSNIQPNEHGTAQDYGIDVIPTQYNDMDQMFDFVNLYLTQKTSIRPSEPDSVYCDYVLDKFKLLTKIEKINKTEIINRLFAWIIENRNNHADYAFCLHRLAGAQMGSLAYELVKLCVKKSGNNDLAKLFYANCAIGHLGEKKGLNHIAITMRNSNNGYFFVETTTLLQILSCVGPHNFINGSCLRTPDAKIMENLIKYNKLTQDSAPNSPMYSPNSPMYSPKSPEYSPPYSQHSPEDLTIEDLRYSPGGGGGGYFQEEGEGGEDYFDEEEGEGGEDYFDEEEGGGGGGYFQEEEGGGDGGYFDEEEGGGDGGYFQEEEGEEEYSHSANNTNNTNNTNNMFDKNGEISLGQLVTIRKPKPKNVTIRKPKPKNVTIRKPKPKNVTKVKNPKNVTIRKSKATKVKPLIAKGGMKKRTRKTSKCITGRKKYSNARKTRKRNTTKK